MRRAPVLLAASLALVGLALAGCNPAPPAPAPELVYLRVQGDFAKSSCNQRLSFQRIGPDGQPAGPADANGNFTIPAGKTLTVTDIHATYEPAQAGQQQITLYIQAASRLGETPVWFPTITAPVGGRGVYDRALTSGVRVAAGAQVCVAYRDQTSPTSVVLTGTLQ